jgi:hypothetical protein
MHTRIIASHIGGVVIGLLTLFACPPVWTDWHQVTNVPQWGRFLELTSVDFAGKMWVFDSDLGGSVWSCPDGVGWERVLDRAPWLLGCSGTRHATAVFDDKIWLVTGFDIFPSLGVWSSSDGLNWAQVLASPPWVHQTGGPCVVHDGKLWVIGERSHYNTWPEKGVWCSLDGITWTKTGDGAALGERTEHSALAYDGKIWVMGGFVVDDIRDFVNDVWYTVDGVNWVRATEHAAWSPRLGRATLAYAGKMWVMGGGKNDVWYSTDGAEWTAATLAAEWPPMSPASVVFDDKMWVIGSYGNVWSSTDGAHWSDEGMRRAPWGEGRPTTSVKSGVKDGELWVIEGPGSPPQPNTVWHSADGEAWTELPGPPPWEKRSGFGFLTFNGKLWVFGGQSGPREESPHYYYLNDVWSSEDGQTWDLVSAAAPWSARSDFGTAVFDGNMWILGGCDSCTSDVWYSSDGQNWLQATAAAPWGPTGYHISVTVLDDKLWVLGKGPSQTRDIWRSSNGSDWEHVSAAPPWAASWGTIQVGRVDPLFAAYAGMLWFGGGTVCFEDGCAYAGDVWYSPHGVQWIQAPTVPWTARAEQAAAVFNGKLWMLGGTGDQGFTREVWYYQHELSFTTVPEGGWKEEGDALRLEVGVTGALGDVTYQWVKDGEALEGETSSVLTVPSLQLTDEGYYWCVVTDESESKTAHESPHTLVSVFPAGSLPVSRTLLTFAIATMAVVASLALYAFRTRQRKHQLTHPE